MLSSSRKSYTLAFKRSALLKLAENDGNISKTAKQMGLARQLVQQWNKNSEVVMRFSERKRKRSGGATPPYPYSPEGTARKRRRVR